MGFWSDIAEAGLGITIGVTSLVCPPLGASIAITSTVVGGTTAFVGHVRGDEEMKEAGMILFKPGVSTVVGAGVAVKTVPHKSCSLPLTFCKK